MQLSPGSRKEDMYTKLKKYIYSLNQSLWEWYSCLTQHLIPLSFTIISLDLCILVNKKNNTYIAINIDNLTLYGSPSKFIEDTINLLKTKFEVTDLRTVH